ncbi:hypothetical protein ROTO_35640 [Roseovarius tolerans]|uniref:DUF5681 domain-containing protein n=1 Tax=Roseovarius tolerans TaxID=74031 RepID=A0A0L6CQ74_9RHOB|nr:DUF5681 domain-containing protein [Roseovarius tolerans]KNX39897.1 hypothetical protein ROTO_35640 [Roseovarius tolerans]
MTTNDNDHDYDVGYGKPPKHSQFQKGQSGNPNGRPKGSKNISTILRERLFSKVTIVENGRRKQITMVEALFRTLLKSGLEGDVRALDRLIKLLPLAEADTLAADEVTDASEIDATDEAILRHFIKMRGSELLDTSGQDKVDEEGGDK